jgi:hypothetical protein
MRRIALCLFVLVSVLVAAPVMAQDYSEYYYGAGIGPLASFGFSDAEVAYGLYGYFDYDLSELIFLRGTASYLAGDFNSNEVPGDEFSTVGLDLSVLGRILVYEGWIPYGGVGVGYYFNDLESDTEGDVQIDDSFGMFLAAGAQIPVQEPLNLELGARVLFMRPDGPDFVQLELDSMIFNIGLNYRF